MRRFIASRADYVAPQFFPASACGHPMNATASYHGLIKSPLRDDCGEADETMTIGVAAWR